MLKANNSKIKMRFNFMSNIKVIKNIKNFYYGILSEVALVPSILKIFGSNFF